MREIMCVMIGGGLGLLLVVFIDVTYHRMVWWRDARRATRAKERRKADPVSTDRRRLVRDKRETRR